ncbi:MAG: transposase [Bacteroidota bacterium]
MIAFRFLRNLYQLLLRQNGQLPLSDFIKVVFNAYAQEPNKWRQRSGSLLEGRFTYVHVDSDLYVLQLCRYIHLNPVEAGFVTAPVRWLYSIYQEWIGMRSTWMYDPEFVKRYFPWPRAYQAFVIGRFVPSQNLLNHDQF